MLTHRNKKPYECTVDGCPKSYCDARSLRRHEENHHHLKGLPALKDKDSEKEARRRNSKTILSLLATPSADSSNTDTSQAASLKSPTTSTATDAGVADTSGLTSPETSLPDTAFQKSVPPGLMPTPMGCHSPVATPAPSPTGLHAAARTQEPITVPTVRPQLVATRVLPTTQNNPQQGMQFRLLLDQPFPQSSGTQGTLLLSRSPPNDSHPNGVLSAYLSPTQQVSQIQLTVSQPQLLTGQVQQLKVTTPRSTTTTTQAQTAPSFTGIARQQISITSPEKNEQLPKLVQSVTWPQVLATSVQTAGGRLSTAKVQPLGASNPIQDTFSESFRLGAGEISPQLLQLPNGSETLQRQGVTDQVNSGVIRNASMFSFFTRSYVEMF